MKALKAIYMLGNAKICRNVRKNRNLKGKKNLNVYIQIAVSKHF